MLGDILLGEIIKVDQFTDQFTEQIAHKVAGKDFLYFAAYLYIFLSPSGKPMVFRQTMLNGFYPSVQI